MVLGHLIEKEIEQVDSTDQEISDYGKRIDEILDYRTAFPAGDMKLEDKLEEYKKEVEDKDVPKEVYLSDLEEILEDEPGPHG